MSRSPEEVQSELSLRQHNMKETLRKLQAASITTENDRLTILAQKEASEQEYKEAYETFHNHLKRFNQEAQKGYDTFVVAIQELFLLAYECAYLHALQGGLWGLNSLGLKTDPIRMIHRTFSGLFSPSRSTQAASADVTAIFDLNEDGSVCLNPNNLRFCDKDGKEIPANPNPLELPEAVKAELLGVMDAWLRAKGWAKGTGNAYSKLEDNGEYCSLTKDAFTACKNEFKRDFENDFRGVSFRNVNELETAPSPALGL